MDFNGVKSFIFGEGTDTPTYDALKRKRAVIDALMQQNDTPRTAVEGIASAGKSVLGAILDRRLAPQEDDARKSISEALAGLTSGGGYSGSSGTPFAPSGAPGGSASFRDAISGIESGGNYGATGPQTKTGDRAYGKYQIMGANIPDWTKDALGQSLTPEQFLANPQAQDATFDKTFGGYAEKYGPAGAASMWFSGDPTPDGDQDQLGTSDNSYVDKFMQALGGGGGLSGMMQHEPDMAKISKIAEIMDNPYVTTGQQLVAKALLDRELGGGNGMTPYQLAQLGMDQQRLNLDRDKFAQGTREGVQSYGTAQWAMRDNPATPEPDPAMAPYVIDKAGNVKWLDLGGAQPLPPTQNVNLGTSIQPLAPGATPIGAPLPVDKAGEAAATATGKAQGEAIGGAQVQLGPQKQMLDEVTSNINAIVSDPALDQITGKWNSMKPNWLTSQDGVNLRKRIEQFRSTTFMTARQLLKGAGQVTDYEGQKAEEAFSFAAESTDPETFKARMGEALAHLQRGFEVMQQQAAGDPTGGVMPAAKGTVIDGYTVEPAD